MWQQICGIFLTVSNQTINLTKTDLCCNGLCKLMDGVTCGSCCVVQLGSAAALRAALKHFGLFFCCLLLSKHHCVNDGIALQVKKVTSTYTGTKRASFLLELAMI